MKKLILFLTLATLFCASCSDKSKEDPKPTLTGTKWKAFSGRITYIIEFTSETDCRYRSHINYVTTEDTVYATYTFDGKKVIFHDFEHGDYHKYIWTEAEIIGESMFAKYVDEDDYEYNRVFKKY